MRLDLFLKTSRLIKRRAVARELCERGNVQVNGHEAKPAKEVRQGDFISLTFPSRMVEIEVLHVPELAHRKTAPEELYRVTSERKNQLKQDLWKEDRGSQ